MAARSLITLCVLCLSGISEITVLSAASFAANRSANVNVSLTHASWAHCGKNPALKLSLQVQIENVSQNAFVLGQINVAQERLYREGEEGKLELIRTTVTPEEFTDGLSNPFEKIEETNLPSHASKTFAVKHYVYLSSSDVQRSENVGRIIASFHITNVRQDGGFSAYWSRLVSITIPEPCELY